MKKITILLGLFLLAGCAINISKNIEDVIFFDTNASFYLSEIGHGDFVIVPTNDIRISAYARSFKKEYEDSDSFGLKISEMISEGFKILTGSSPRVTSRVGYPVITEGEIRGELAARDEEFSVIIKQVRIGEDTVSQSSQNGHTGMGTSSFSSHCMVGAEVEIWNNITLEKVFAFIAYGRTEATFAFFFRASLRNAVEESCHNVAEVLAGKYKSNHQ
ncbi:MAG: hypothetical protein JRI86_08185 [Deltaproteobacteria bacterium]|nr:hypothetical protein [Deltaproteobacteria bacterium]